MHVQVHLYFLSLARIFLSAKQQTRPNAIAKPASSFKNFCLYTSMRSTNFHEFCAGSKCVVKELFKCLAYFLIIMTFSRSTYSRSATSISREG